MEKQKRIVALITLILVLATLIPQTTVEAKTMEEWFEGFESGENWFGEDFAYDITDVEACWELLQQPITILDDDERTAIYPRVSPGGDRVNEDKLGGFINSATAAVKVLGEDEDGWTLIQGLDYYDRLITGYVKTSLLKTVTPNEKYGVIVDKLYQRMYVFIDGEYFSSVAVSTGLVNDEQPYNETASGEYLTSSWVGGFDSEGMYCDMAIRFNNGDLIHQVPYTTLADGTKRFSPFEEQLGTKASHGCIRVARMANDDGLNQKWLWDNLKRNTKVVIWDDDGRLLPYPDDDMPVYYNPDGGSNYHSTATCSAVRSQYLPLTEFTYGELDDEPYASLTPCASCSPDRKKEDIDADNIARGVITQEEIDALADAKAAEVVITTNDDDNSDDDDTQEAEDTHDFGFEDGEVSITIF